MNLFQSFQQHVARKQFFGKADKLLLAVSGGMDSMALAHILHVAGYTFSIAHMNFQLRGEESAGDEQWVRDWGKHHGIAVFSKKADTEKYATEMRLGIQEAARELRYTWFAELAKENGFSKILTAHHADDNVETLLQHFFRGTGVSGLTGIRECRGILVRPLLFVSRKEIADYVKEHSIAYREDSSNLTTKYNRNFLRLELIPMLQKHYPSLSSNLLQTVSRFVKLEAELSHHVEARIQRLAVREKSVVKYPAQGLLKSDFRSQVLMKILTGAGFHAPQLGEFEKLLTADSGKFIISATHRILKDRRWILVSPIASPNTDFYLAERETSVITTPSGTLTFEVVDQFNPTQNVNIEIIDATHLTFPLILRKWRKGDYFFPLGMKHKKKLSRFFIDEKLSIPEKENVWVLESDRRIVWIVGRRLSERFSVRQSHSSLLKLVWNPARGSSSK